MLLSDVFIGVVLTISCAFLSIFVAVRRLICHFFQLKVSMPEKNRNVLISGCDSGFGYLAALKFGEHGFRVFAGCLTEKGASQFEGRKNVVPFRLDITQQSSVDGAVQRVEKELGSNGGLWALINNAGVSGPAVGDSLTTVADYEFVMKVNFFGQIRMTKAFMPLLTASRGRLIQMTSTLANIAMGGCAPYVASKHAILGATESLRKEIAATKDVHVSVSTIVPGFFRTNLYSEDSVKANLQARIKEKGAQNGNVKYDDKYVEQFVSSMVGSADQCSANNSPQAVVEAYFDAATARYPKPTYWVGLDAAIVFRLLRMTNADAQAMVEGIGLRMKTHPGF